MALLNYSNSINGVEFEESTGFLWLIINDLYKTTPNFEGLKSLLVTKWSEADINPEKYKKEYRKYYNTNKDILYREIEHDIMINDEDTILFIKSTICRLYDWFLLSDKELSTVENECPPVLDNNIQIFKNYQYKEDFKKQREVNIENINDFLGYETSVNIDDLMKKSDNLFLSLLGSSVLEFRGSIRRLIRKNKLYKRTTNKSASFYKINELVTNSYVENLYSYDSNLLYKYYLTPSQKEYNFIKLNQNFDYIRFNTIKNKCKGTRNVFFTNPQINSFLKPINDEFEKAFRNIKYLGIYDQDRAISDLINLVESNINRHISVLCLDASKYSDTLPISIIRHVINLLIDDKHLTNAICECLNLPVLYNGELVEHNASLQGVYFDFAAITMVNLYIQCAICSSLNQNMIMANVVGDDAYNAIVGDQYHLYAEKAREIWANFGCKVNEDKKIACNMKEGHLTYLKYYAEMKDNKLINLSGLSPGLLLKNIHSYARLSSTISYLKKCNYYNRCDIPIDLLTKFHKNFCNIIYNAQRTKILRVSEEEALYIKENAVDLMKSRPFLFGGFKDYNLSKQSDRKVIIDEIEDGLRYIEYHFIDKNDTLIPVIEELKSKYHLSNSVLDDDINIFISEEFNEMYAKLIEFKRNSKHFIETGEGDIRSIRGILKNLTDKRFTKYIPGGLTTDRITLQPFEDKMLIAPIMKPIDIGNMIYLPYVSSIEDKNVNILTMKIISSNKNIIRNSYNYKGTKFINLSNNKILTFSGPSTGNYISVDDWIKLSNYRAKNNISLWEQDMGIVASGLYQLYPDNDMIKFIEEDPNRLYKILETLSFSCKHSESRYEKLKELIEDYVDNYKREYILNKRNSYVKNWMKSI